MEMSVGGLWLVGCMGGCVGRWLVDLCKDVGKWVVVVWSIDGCVGKCLVDLWMDVSVRGWCLLGV